MNKKCWECLIHQLLLSSSFWSVLSLAIWHGWVPPPCVGCLGFPGCVSHCVGRSQIQNKKTKLGSIIGIYFKFNSSFHQLNKWPFNLHPLFFSILYLNCSESREEREMLYIESVKISTCSRIEMLVCKFPRFAGKVCR